MQARKRSVRLGVFSPVSERAVRAGNAPRLDTLRGKTICEVWETGAWGGDRTFPVIRKLLQERFPDTKIVPYTELPVGDRFPRRYWVPLDQVAEVLRSKGCDAVLFGNGG